MSLDEVFFAVETMEDECNFRFLPHLSSGLKDALIKDWRGQVDRETRKKLARYGIFDDDGNDWSCEYVRRKYFCDLFHTSNSVLIGSPLFESGSIPSELDLIKIGLGNINWQSLKQFAGSSQSGFPIEDVWQAEFYGSIGKFIPRNLVFCKEYVVDGQTHNPRVDFVLRNGGTRAIEFLIKSSDVGGHHRRFENGAYKSLKLSGSYMVVDIQPWDNEPDLNCVSDPYRLQRASGSFEALTKLQQLRHALFLVSSDLSSGILYVFDREKHAVVECLRSPF